jgi:hypothetical protein
MRKNYINGGGKGDGYELVNTGIVMKATIRESLF